MNKAKVLLLVGCGIVLAACGDGYNRLKVREAIRAEFKSDEIVNVPGKDWQFIIRDTSGNIWVAEAMSNDAVVTAKTLIFASKEK
jgi:hypothetical protein